MAKKEIEIGQKCAFIRDNALVLYFDKAETPFVARYDLDSLAQANFEVTDKKDGVFTLSLRDYSGRSQDVGQFGNKADAHQALYTILQALLEHTGQNGARSCKPSGWCGIGCAILKLFKWILLIIGALVVLYGLLSIIPVSGVVSDHAAPLKMSSPVVPPQGAQTSLSSLPEGEAVDADTLFGNNSSTDDASQQQDQNADDAQTSETETGTNE